MTFSPTSGQVVLKEVFDEKSVPTDEEIYDYALRIGIDVENEPHLLYLARDGLMQALPPGWKPCYDKDKKEIYYFNFKTKKAQWEHPLDDIYRNYVKKARNESILSEQVDDDSKTSLREDLKSYEEASLILMANDMYPKPKKLEPLNPLGKSTLKKVTNSLSPITKSNSKDLSKSVTLKPVLFIDEEKLLQKSEHDHPSKLAVFDETEVRKRPNSSDIRNRRNIGPMEFRHLSKQEIIPSNGLEKLNFLTETKKLSDNKICNESPSIEIKGTESGCVTKDEGYGTEFSVSSLGEKDPGKKELTLVGGGSVFLKNNKAKFSPSSEIVTSSFSKEELSEGLLSPDVRKSGHDFDSQPKSILREQSNQKVNEKASVATGEKKIRKDDSEDEKKSVRFNLEKELKISFEIPSAAKDESESGSTSGEKNSKCENSSPEARDKQETRQIEIDFDELEICLSDDKLEKSMDESEKVPMESVKTVEPKKFKPSQLLVKEFREIFENQPKNINFLESSRFENAKNSTVKSSRCSTSGSSSSRSATSQSEKISQPSQENYSSMKREEIKVGQSENPSEPELLKLNAEDKMSSDVFDSTFAELVDFAIKKKLDIIPGKEENPNGKIEYRERDFLLEEILKENNEIDSEEESGVEKEFVSQDQEMEYLEKLECRINSKAQRRRETSEKIKLEKLNELEMSYEMWLRETEESYEKKKLEASMGLKEKYEDWMREKEKRFEKTYKEKWEKETESRMNELKNEFTKRENSDIEKLKFQLDSEQRERLKNFKIELESRESKELDSLRKSFENGLNEKKVELMKKHREEMEKIERNLEDLLSEQKSQKLKELELVKENESVIEVMRLEMKESYQKQKNKLMKEHELLLENMKREHDLVVEQMKIEFKKEEESLRKAHQIKLEEIRIKTEAKNGMENVDVPRSENAEARVFEKVRCEKRLLEDKYKTLKEKYIRLKAETKSSLEKNKKKKDSFLATESETEKSSSHVTNSATRKVDSDSPNLSRKQLQQQQQKEKTLKKQLNRLEYLNRDGSTEDEENLTSSKYSCRFQKNPTISDSGKKQKSKNDEKQSREEFSGEEKKLSGDGNEAKKKRKLFSRLKAVSTSGIGSNNKNQGKDVLSPVENLRRQLKKLEELEDQFPVTSYTDTYMRYPFPGDAQFGSSEIEFFKHRIHLERESVRRAKDSLKSQKRSFENRQRELKQRLIEREPGSKVVIDQIYQEEKELTDMEVSVYRTRALLGEKIIRLRHLEQSLKRISQPLKKDSFALSKGKDLLGKLGVRNQSKDDEKTLSDLSSYSGSSGFSSTDFNDVQNAGIKVTNLEQSRNQFQNNMQESSEIIQSLENLNSEIREIWEVLKKQHHHQTGKETIAMLPPPPLIYGDLGWSGFTLSPPLPFRNTVITSTSNFQRPVAQQFKTQVTRASNLGQVSTIMDSTLVDRTRSLRDWLKAARNFTPTEGIGSGQVTL